MEYCPEGTLEEVCREGLLDMRYVRRYTHFLLKGVEYIHMKMIIHRDIKRNIFPLVLLSIVYRNYVCKNMNPFIF